MTDRYQESCKDRSPERISGKGIEKNRWFLVLKSGVYLIAGFGFFCYVIMNPTMDLFLLLRIIAGCALLYEGAIIILRIYADMKRAKNAEYSM